MALERSGHLRGPEAHGPRELEGRDQPGNSPFVELPEADLEEAGEFGFGQQLKFAARLNRLLVHAREPHVNRRSGDKR